MSKSQALGIHLASDGDFCVCHNSVKRLKRLPHLKLRLTGPDIDGMRDFAQLNINGATYLADVVTGTLYDHTGRHHNNPLLRVHNVPQRLLIKPSQATQVTTAD
jgi:hypothetical protein